MNLFASLRIVHFVWICLLNLSHFYYCPSSLIIILVSFVCNVIASNGSVREILYTRNHYLYVTIPPGRTRISSGESRIN